MSEIVLTCHENGESFIVNERDQAFYKSIDVPMPTLCPQCRSRRRLSFRNQRSIYKRTCDYTGKTMISLYSADKPLKVYKEEIWWSDKWDPLEYGRDFSFDKTLFQQIKELQSNVPRRGMHQDGTNENSTYCTFGMNNKNGYLVFACFYTEDCFYCDSCGMTKDCMDCLLCSYCELCYGCLQCEKCYNSFYLKDCKGCTDSYLLEDCSQCKFCIGCKNMSNKSYYIYNKKATKEEYETLKRKFRSYTGLQEEKKNFNRWKLQFPYKFAHIIECENCTGNYLEHAKNCSESYDIMLGAEDCSHCQFAGWQGKNMVDCTMAGKECETLYEMHATATAQRSAFSSFCRYCSEIYYSEMISNADHCFGCIGLNHKNYCILNKQYKKEEYTSLVYQIIEHMRKTGEWGEFFPISSSPFCYNETWAFDNFPLTKDEVMGKGWNWKDVEEVEDSTSAQTIKITDLPDNIDDVTDSIINNQIICETSGRLYRVIKAELAYYRRLGIPLPREHFDIRYKRLLSLRLPRQLWERTCEKCGKLLKSPYASERPERIFCEECYQKEIY